MGTGNKGEISKEWVDRDLFIQVTCPYCFNYGFVLDLYKEAKDKDILDKVEPHTTTLMLFMGHQLFLSKGYLSNMKITAKEDLKLYEGWCLMKKNEATSLICLFR